MSPTPPRSQDREWLGYDQGQDDAQADSSQPDPSQADSSAPPATPDPAAEGPWLRHDLTADEAGDGRGAPAHDPAWLAPEVDVPATPATGEQTHDTGVPPTLAEEPLTVQPSNPPARPGEPRAEASVDTDELGEKTSPLAAHADAEAGVDEEAEPEAGLFAVMGAAIKEFAIVVGMALVLSFIVKTWLLQAFYIPSGSMEDTLVLNDRVIVSKLTPGPIDLKRGDIIVFADPGQWLEETPQAPHGKVVTAVREAMTFIGLLPDNSENHLIKRVIGLPGDHVVCCDEGGRLTVNGVGIKEPYLKPGDAASEQDFDITVPKGRVWVMGDHRSNSADSRAHDAPENNGSQGSVDERLIVGRAVALVWPLDHMTWLSNPTATFAKIPAPTAEDGSPPADQDGGPGTQTGGAEVTGDGKSGG